MAADVGSLARSPKTFGNESFTREVALTGRDFDASEALQAGFLSRVVEGDKKAVLGAPLYGIKFFDKNIHTIYYVDAALETAKLIASKSPIAVMGTKHIILHARDHR